jgi:hypothetical protein
LDDPLNPAANRALQIFAMQPTAWRSHPSPSVIPSHNAAIVIPSHNTALVIPSRNAAVVIPSRRRGISAARNAEIPRVRSG